MVVLCVIAVRRKAVVVICVITVRLRHCNTSEPTASVSFDGVTSMDVVRTYMLHVPKNGGKIAGSKRNETENGNKTKRRTVIKRNGTQTVTPF